MGDHPVIWTNDRMAAHNGYIFMGHGPDLIGKQGIYHDLAQCDRMGFGKAGPFTKVVLR